MINKKLFFGGLIWLASIVFVIINAQGWAASWCEPNNNYPCLNKFEMIISLAILAPSAFFLKVVSPLRRYTFFIGVFSASAVVILSFMASSYESICNYYPQYGYSIRYCENIVAMILPLILTVPLSIILLLFREEVFRAWFRLICWLIPVTIAVVLFIPESELQGRFFDVTKVEISLLSSSLIFILSLLLIAWKYLFKRTV